MPYPHRKPLLFHCPDILPSISNPHHPASIRSDQTHLKNKTSRMGQALKTLNPGVEEKQATLLPIIESCYDEYFSDTTKDWTAAEFYSAVCSIVMKINKKFGNTQFRVPETELLQEAYDKYHKGKGKSLTKEQFQKILQEVITRTGFTGIGAKDTLFYIFGVPATSLFIKQGLMPRAVPNEIFIPVVTSATVLFLSMLNKV